jgi:hypothetical protein
MVAWTALGFCGGATAPTIFGWLGRAGVGRGGFALLATTSMFGFSIGPAAMGQAASIGLEWPFRLAAGLALVAALLVARSTAGRIIAASDG